MNIANASAAVSLAPPQPLVPVPPPPRRLPGQAPLKPKEESSQRWRGPLTGPRAAASVTSCLEAIITKLGSEPASSLVASGFLQRTLPPVADAAITLLKVAHERIRVLKQEVEALKTWLKTSEDRSHAQQELIDRHLWLPRHEVTVVGTQLQEAQDHLAELTTQLHIAKAKRDAIQKDANHLFGGMREDRARLRAEKELKRDQLRAKLEATREQLEIEREKLEAEKKEATVFSFEVQGVENEASKVDSTEQQLRALQVTWQQTSESLRAMKSKKHRDRPGGKSGSIAPLKSFSARTQNRSKTDLEAEEEARKLAAVDEVV